MTRTLATSQHIFYLSRLPSHPRPQCRSYALRPGSLGSVPDIRAPPTKSMRVLIKEATESSLIPNEMGLAPGWCLQLSFDCIQGLRTLGTIVMPAWNNRPSLFSSPRDRLKLEWRRLQQRVLDFGGWVS